MLRTFCFVALFFAALTPGFGQPDPSATPVSPRPLPTAVIRNGPSPAPVTPPSSADQAPAAVPPAQTTAAPPPTVPGSTPLPDRTVTLQYPNSDVVDVLHLYATLTGKKLIMDNFVQGKVSIFLSRPVPREEAIKIIEINLLMNGYSLVPAEDDIVKVIGANKSPRNAGVAIISDEADIPANEQVVSFLFKLNYADPIELQQVLTQYLQPAQIYTSFLALPKSGSVLITENSAVIRKLVRIIEQIDVPPAQVVSEFIKLQRADASKVVEMLKEVFDKGGTTTTTTTVQPGVRPVRPPTPNVPQPPQVQIEGDLSAFTALSEDSIVVGKIKIAADVRTNRIHVITRPVNMPFIKKLIAEFDANVEFGKPITRALRYISAADVLPVLVQALTEPGTGQAAGADATTNPAAPQQQAQQNQRRTTGTTGGFDSTSGSTTGGQDFAEELSTQSVDTTPKAVTIGNAKIIADQRSNSIIVLGNREVVVKVAKILDEMDVSAPQVALSTVIGELTINNNDEFGIDWFLRGGEKRVGTTNFTGIPPYAGGSTTTTGDTPTSTGGSIFFPGINFTQLATAAAGGANVYVAAGNTLATVVHALHSTGRFKTISRPTVFTSNNKKAIIASGTEIPVPVSTIAQPVGTSIINNNLAQQSNIQFKKVALQLEVVPLINSEKEVTLDILQKLDSLAGATIVSGNSIPNIATRYIKTTVTAPNCSTIVLGGLITDDKRRDASGIPILSKIPVIGGLFRNTTKSKSRAELIILMRPEVSLTKLDLHRLRQKNEDKTHFGPELDQDDCPDCPVPLPTEDKEIVLPEPDLPGMK